MRMVRQASYLPKRPDSTDVSTSYDIQQRKNPRLSCVEFRIKPNEPFAFGFHNFNRYL